MVNAQVHVMLLKENCPEYSGNITVNEAGTAVTFTITHGMDWGNSIMPFALEYSCIFYGCKWAASMTDSGWERRMHFWDPDSHQSYTFLILLLAM